MKKLFTSIILVILILSMSTILVGCKDTTPPLICTCTPVESTPPCACPVEPQPDPPAVPRVNISIISQLFTSEARETVRSSNSSTGYSETGATNRYGSWGMLYIEIINYSDTTISVIDFFLSYDDKIALSLPHHNFDRHLYSWSFPFKDPYDARNFDLHLSSQEHIAPNSTKNLIVNFNIPRKSPTDYYLADTTVYTLHAIARNVFTGAVTELTTTTLNLTQA